MYNTSNSYKEYINNNLEREYKLKVLVGDNEINRNDILDFSIETIQPENNFTIGNSISQILKLDIRNQAFNFYLNQIYVEIGMKLGTSFEYIPIGYFNIDSSKKEDNHTQITAYDNFYKLEGLYNCQLSSNKKLYDIMNDITQKTGIQFEKFDYKDYSISEEIAGYSYREVISMMAGLNGGNAYITREGKIKFVYISDKTSRWEITDFHLFEGNTFEEQVKTIDKITCYKDKDTSWSKGIDGINSLEIVYENPFITEAITNDIYSKLKDTSYQAFSMDTMSYLALDPGDWITYTSQDNVEYKLCIQHYKYTGGIRQELEAKINNNKDSFKAGGSLTQKVNRTITDLLAAKKAIIDKANITDLIADNIKVDTITGQTATLQEIMTSFITGAAGQFLHLTGSNVVFDDAIIKDAMIDTINANKLSAGSIDTEKIKIESEKLGYKFVNEARLMQWYKKINDEYVLIAQIGFDASNKFSFIIKDETGTFTKYDQNGITKNAVPDGLIVNDMVSDSANISGSKLDINSVLQEVNNNSTTTLKAAKVKLDETNQTLDVAFKQLDTKVTNVGQTGLNMFRFSQGFNITYWNKSGNCALVNQYQTVNGLRCSVYKTYGQWSSVRQGITLEVGKTYTVSCIAKATQSGIGLSLFTNPPSGGIDFGANNTVITTDMHSYFAKYSYTFTAKASGSALPRFESPNADLDEANRHFYICAMMICEGTNTNYNLNPRDNVPLHKNILHGTGDFNSKYWVAKETYNYTGNPKYKMARLYCNPFNAEDRSAIKCLSTDMSEQGFDFRESNKTFIVQAVIRPSADDLKIGVTVSGSRVNYQPQDLGSANVWKKIYWIFRGDNKWLTTFRLENPTGGTFQDYVDIALIKVTNDTNELDDYSVNDEDILESTHSLQTKFTVQQGQIEQLIKDTTIETTGGGSQKLKDKVNQINSTVEGTTQTVSDLQTEVLGDNGIKNKMATVEAKLTSDGFKIQSSKSNTVKLKVRYVRDWIGGSNASNNNHWSEIQVINNMGVNLALNKIPTSNVTLTNSTYCTDGKIDTYTQITNSIKVDNYVQIDLESVHEDVEYIKVWHYSDDDRIYYNSKTEISNDGVHWINLFDSASEGTYKESKNGHKVLVNNSTFSTATTTMDDNGLHQKGGVIDIQNAFNDTVLSMNTSGNLELNGEITQHRANKTKAISLKNNGLNVYDLNSVLVGGARFDQYAFGSDSTNLGDCFRVFGNYKTCLVLGTLLKDKEAGGGVTSYHDSIMIDATKQHTDGAGEILITDDTVVNSNLKIAYNHPIDFHIKPNEYPKARIGLNGIGILSILTHYLTNQINIGQMTNGGENIWLSINDSGNTFEKSVTVQNGGIHVGGDSSIGGQLSVFGKMIVSDGLTCRGNKNRAVDIGDGWYLLQNAYETCECYFGDILEASTDENGYCKINYAEDFLMTVNTKIPYHVFITEFGDEEMSMDKLKELWVKPVSKTENYCIVKGSPKTKFSFEIKAKQREYENTRLEKVKF